MLVQEAASSIDIVVDNIANTSKYSSGSKPRPGVLGSGFFKEFCGEHNLRWKQYARQACYSQWNTRRCNIVRRVVGEWEQKKLYQTKLN